MFLKLLLMFPIFMLCVYVLCKNGAVVTGGRLRWRRQQRATGDTWRAAGP